MNVRILEIDGERRRLSLSLKRVEEGDQPVPRADGAESVHTMPDLKLSEEAFPTSTAAPAIEAETEAERAGGRCGACARGGRGDRRRGRGRGRARGRVEAETESEPEAAEEIADEVVAEVEIDEADEADVAEAAEQPSRPSAAVEVGSEQSDSD